MPIAPTCIELLCRVDGRGKVTIYDDLAERNAIDDLITLGLVEKWEGGWRLTADGRGVLTRLEQTFCDVLCLCRN